MITYIKIGTGEHVKRQTNKTNFEPLKSIQIRYIFADNFIRILRIKVNKLIIRNSILEIGRHDEVKELP